MRTARLYAVAIEVGALADIIDARRHDESFRARSFGNAPRRFVDRRVRQRGEKVGELRLELGPMIRLGGDVAQHDGAIDQRRADAFERGEHGWPGGLYQIGELAQKEQIAYSAHMLVGPIR